MIFRTLLKFCCFTVVHAQGAIDVNRNVLCDYGNFSISTLFRALFATLSVDVKLTFNSYIAAYLCF